MISFILFLVFACFAAAIPRPSLPYDSGDELDEPYLHVVVLEADSNDPHQIHTSLAQVNLHPDHEDVIHIYNNSAFKGFSVFADRQRYHQINNISSVKLVERDAEAQAAAFTRTPAPWGLQRVSLGGTLKGSEDGLNSTYSFNNADLGQGVDIYVLDTGIYTENSNFGGRASNVWPNSTILDNDGHGTHCAGIAGSDTYGVASQANLVGVQVLPFPGGAGTTSLIVAGMTFAMETHDAKKAAGTLVGSVLSMSLNLPDGGPQDVMTYATNVVLSKGMHMVAAAGNSAADACAHSPANMGGSNSSAIIVGSIGYDNAISSFSSFGQCVDVYAPGENILSTWVNGTDATHILEGTSMSTPFVTGIVAAQISANSSLALDPAAMKAWLKSVSLPGFVTGNDTGVASPLLANNGVTVGPVLQAHRHAMAAAAGLKQAGI